MSAAPEDPPWLRWLSRQVLRLVPGRVQAAIAAVAIAVVIGIAHGASALEGRAQHLLLTVAAIVAVLAAGALASLLVAAAARVEQARRQMGVLAIQDDLTGVHNRRYFLAAAEREWSRCRRYGTDAALLLIDADHFKSINDSHGHACGDALLREIARATAQSLRQPDVLARFGGEELIVFLPHTDPLGALDVAERVRVRVGDLRLAWQGLNVGTTVSVGVASVAAAHDSLDGLIHEADLALRAAKEAGRNCVRSAPIQPRRSGEAYPVISR